MLTANTTLAIFLMFGLSSLALFWAKKVRLPHTVFLVVLGTIIGALSMLPIFSFFREFNLTPELLFYLLLPTLIFESAYNINIRRLLEETGAILTLAIVSLIVSTLVIACLLFGFFQLINFPVPFIILLLFGALISATDPVAVLSLFKEYGAPRRLSLIFEGESLFNDATAVALFLVILGVVTTGFSGTDTVLEGLVSFTSMLAGGVLFGLLIGGIFMFLIGFTRNNETATITLTIVLAHATFILTDITSSVLHIGSFNFELSPIISTTIASLLMGNYGRAKISPHADEFVEKLWSQFAFMANSLVFILIGVVFVNIPLMSESILIILIATILIVAFARACSVYPIVYLFNFFASTTQKIPTGWQHLLSWGSLRGALAVTMVLLIPHELTFGSNNTSVQDFLLTLTVGCIFATLFIKATTIQSFMKRLKLDALTPIETIGYYEAKAILNREITLRLNRYVERGYIDSTVANELEAKHKEEYVQACATIGELSKETRHQLSHVILRLYAIGIERRHLKELYHHGEISESVYRKLLGKLQIQYEAIEHGELEPNMSIHTDSKDVFEIMATTIRRLFKNKTDQEKITDLYMYYRAQLIISRKVTKELSEISKSDADNIFTPEALNDTTSLYKKYMEQSQKKMLAVADEHVALAKELSRHLAGRGIDKIAETILNRIQSRELITPKLYITLRDEVEKTLHSK